MLLLRRSCSRDGWVRSDTHAPLAPDYAVCDFHLVHDTRIKLYARTRISVGLKSGMNLFICLSQERVLSGYHLNGYRKVYGDDMRTRSRIKVFSVTCEYSASETSVVCPNY